MPVPEEQIATFQCIMIQVRELNHANSMVFISFFCIITYHVRFEDSEYLDKLNAFVANNKCNPKWANELVRLINEKRALHSSPPLVLNSTISEFSQMWANKQMKDIDDGKTSAFLHSGNSHYGENGFTDGDVPEPKDVVGMYSEIAHYWVSETYCLESCKHILDPQPESSLI